MTNRPERIDTPKAGQIPDSGQTNVIRLVARREHCFHSLLELTRLLSPSMRAVTIADRILFNLMGQLCTSRAALWLAESAASPNLVLVRAHGSWGSDSGRRAPVLEAGAFALLGTSRSPVEVAASEDPQLRALSDADVSLVAPVFAGEQAIGVMALGPRVSGDYNAVDLEVLEVAVGVAGAFLENSRLMDRQRVLNEQLKRQNTMLVDMERLRSEFIANTNHELRTPLTVIQAALQCVNDFGLQTPQAPMLLRSALTNTENMTRLVDKLLVFAETREGEFVIPCTVGDIPALLESFLEQLQHRLADSGHPGSLKLEPDLPPARYHSEHLVRVLEELVDNALKFTPRGTALHIAAASVTNLDGSWVAIEFADDGPGIPATDLKRLFESFVQVDGSSTRRVGGLGLGLALARQLLTGMGGRIEVESTVGRGTTFRVLLPAERSPAT